MNKETEIRDAFNKISKDEEKRSKEIGNLASGIKSEAVRSILQVLEADTREHAKFYSMIASMMSPLREAISTGDQSEIKRRVDYHIQEETQHFEKLRQLTQTLDDPKVKLILNMIVEDETRHNKIFQSLKEIIESEKTIEERDVWTLLWEKGVWLGKQS